ncbi:Outer membrane protein TolC [Ruegeria halocynthiae]|uniref:Outer membrane protein TolC n=1 Tax=Ruegeria halocynthiae TaxID=985054 RepID=A0A1H2Y5H7_9RHOB|nr:TolC family protein [Ruegeria halocynthiae]SDX00235.1 Outer membrane protein TolC [Ruegeria halocynthiae]
MQWVKRAIRALSLLGVLSISACAPTPDLSIVETSFSNGTTGAGAIEPSSSLTKSTFGQRVRSAVQSSPTVARSNSGMGIAQANRNAASGAFLPQVSLGLNARSHRTGSNDGDVSPYLRVSQLVYDGGAAANDLAAARARVLESRGDQLQAAAATALAAIETYVMVLDRRELLGITRKNVQVHEGIERQITDRVSGGLGSNADVLTAQSRVADARTRFADAQARVDRAEARFREVFGAAPGRLPPAIPAPDLKRSDSQIVLDSPQIRRADATVIAARADWAAAQARRQPDVRVAAFADQDDFDDADVGVDLSVNYELDSTGRRRAAIAAAAAQVERAEADREVLIREIGRELGFIRSDQKAGALRLREARIATQANAESVAAARAQFSIGRRSLIEILDAQQDYVNAQERLILAEQSYFLTNYAALSLTGDILDLLGVTLIAWDGSL